MSTYDFDEPSPNYTLYLVLALLAGSLIAFGFYLTQCSGEKQAVVDKPILKVKTIPVPEKTEQPTADTTQPEMPPQSAEEILADLENGAESLDPADLIKKIGLALEKGDLELASKLIGKNALSPEQIERLQAMTAASAIKLNEGKPISEIGELEANRRARWALNLNDQFASRIYLDLTRRANGKWGVENLQLPPAFAPGGIAPKAVLLDSLGITDGFLQAALNQEFEDAKSFVNSETVSDATIAGLCIIFEEGKYKLREKKPLRAMFNRDTTAGFMANVESSDGTLVSEFGLLVQRDSEQVPWRVQEINLDKLLADYATRVAGGDVHYTPLIKSPTGGDTLILYFGFDENSLTPRTERQLDIVSTLLKTDPEKKLTLSGYTDSLGTDNYNDTLSAKRAAAVKKYLISTGVPETQIITMAKGALNPRQPNKTEAGEDNPLGRRANRRTEIYLDF